MTVVYQKNGNLEPGIHILTWEEFESEFGFNKNRQKLIIGLRRAIEDLKTVGCKTIYIGGSFVTTKSDPNDFDACWDMNGVDLIKLKNDHPVLLDFSEMRINQKLKYGGELFPIDLFRPDFDFYEFFQTDREDNLKGMVKLII